MTPLQILKQWPSSYNLIRSCRRTCVCSPYTPLIILWKRLQTTRGEGALSDFVTSVFCKISLLDPNKNVILWKKKTGSMYQRPYSLAFHSMNSCRLSDCPGTQRWPWFKRCLSKTKTANGWALFSSQQPISNSKFQISRKNRMQLGCVFLFSFWRYLFIVWCFLVFDRKCFHWL